MRFNRALVVILCPLVLVSALGSSCGVLGRKEDIKRTVAYKNASQECLNGFAAKMQAFLNGGLPTEEWTRVWGCTLSSVDMFQRFVDSSSPQGYTRGDLKALVMQFLVTDRPVSEDLIDAMMKLKASLVGGSPDLVTFAELEFAKKLIKRIQTEAVPLLALLKSRKENPTPRGLIQLVDAIGVFADGVASEFDGRSSFDLSRETADVIVQEAERMNLLRIPPEWVGLGFSGKRLLFSGSGSSIEGRVWPELIGAGAKAVGLLVAMNSVPSGIDNLEFRNEIAQRLYGLLVDAINRHGGVIEFEVLDAIIDELPPNTLAIKTKDGLGHTVDRGVVQAALRPLFGGLLRERVDYGVSQDSIDLLFGTFVKWSDADRHLQRIFNRFGLDTGGVTASRFATAASLYQADLTDGERIDVSRLIQLAQNYKPLFQGNDDQISFIPSNRHSLANLQKLSWMNLAAQLLLGSYGSYAGRTQADEADLTRFISQFRAGLDEMRIVDKTLPKFAKKRFGEADLFMPTSNGNKLLDERELTYYFAYLFSAMGMANNVRDTILPICRIQNGGSDRMQFPWMDPKCFRREYFARFATFWDHLPSMVTYFQVATSDDRKVIAEGMEQAARRFGRRDDQNVGSFDTGAFGNLLHYVESLFNRFDADNNQELDNQEVLDPQNGALAVFKPIIVEVGGLDPSKDRLIRTAFSYMVKYGEMPPQITCIQDDGSRGKCKFPFKGLQIKGDLIKFGAWYVQGLVPGWWKIRSPRAKIYSIVPLITGPPEQPNQPQDDWGTVYDPENDK